VSVDDQPEPRPAFDLTIHIPEWPSHTQRAFVRDLFGFIASWEQPPALLHEITLDEMQHAGTED
jgi:hypothetical protein